ncbi:Atu4866 domain-containing protein [Nonomuraea sp. H19]|uniref:Atu4866 domain-containing protein n=1 Tax=Nonomuraea sp. H19 TaxID=3452206 RepID=UPI003F8BB438
MHAVPQLRPLWLLLGSGLATLIACSASAENRTPAVTPAAGVEATSRADHRYVGMWVTADGHIRQELLPDGRYDEARGSRRSAYTGSYTIAGNHIDYLDDTGFTADGTFISDDVLHHGGYVFHRERR